MQKDGGPSYIPGSAENALRREALDALLKKQNAQLRTKDDAVQSALKDSRQMQRDMEAGKQSEEDGLIYQVVCLAEQYGVDVPEYRKIAEAVKKQTENT